MFNQFNIEINGLNEIVMHNGQTANPQNPFAKQMKEITSKRKKTEADLAALGDLELQASLYTDKKGQVIIPSTVLEAALAEGAKVSKEGKTALSGMFVDTDGKFMVDGKTITVDDVRENEEYHLTVPVVVNRGRVMRTRAQFGNWKASFSVSIDDTLVSENQLRAWIENAGRSKGLCDWRPRHGRFTVASFEKAE